MDRSPWARFATAAIAARQLRLAVAGVWDPATLLPRLAEPNAGEGPLRRAGGCEATVVAVEVQDTVITGTGHLARRPAVVNPALIEAGLSLFGLRERPVAGRASERQALLDQLDSCVTEGRTKVVILRGASGVGKSRLARWLCEHAVETGVGTDFRLFYPEGGAGTDALARALGRALRAGGLPYAEAVEHCAARLVARGCPDHVARSAAHFVASTLTQADGNAPRGSGRHASLLQAAVAVAGSTLPVFWLDDVQWAGEAAAIFDALRALGPPALLVMTAQEEALRQDADQLLWLEECAARGETEQIEISPLPAADHRLAVAALLPFAPALLQSLADRTIGNPLFAAEVVADWVARGELELGEDGFQLTSEEAHSRLPDSLAAAWRTHLQRWLAELAPEGADAFFTAVVLGLRVDRREWERAVSSEVATAVTDGLLAAGFAGPTDDGLAFCHAILRETALTIGGELGALNAAHAAAASALAQDPRPDVEMRCGRHLEAADRPAEAHEAYVRAALHWLQRVRIPDSLRASRAAQRLRGQLDLAGTAAELCTQSRAEEEMGFPDRALDFLEQAIAVDPEDMLIQAKRANHISRWLGRHHEALALTRAIAAAAAAAGDADLVAAADYGEAEILTRLGRHPDAGHAARRAARHSTYNVAWAAAHLEAECWLNSGDAARSQAIAEALIPEASARSDAYRLGASIAVLGQAHLVQRAYINARQNLRQAIALHDSLHLNSVGKERCGLALAEMALGNYDAAREELALAGTTFGPGAHAWSQLIELALNMAEGTPTPWPQRLLDEVPNDWALAWLQETAAAHALRHTWIPTGRGEIQRRAEAARRLWGELGYSQRAQPVVVGAR